MLKALLLDMDETLCDTEKANAKAKALLAQTVDSTYPVDGVTARGAVFADHYVSGIYREWSDQQNARYTPIVNDQGEVAFRIQLIRDLLQPVAVSAEQAQQLQNQFDSDRLAAFDFYPGIKAFLHDARQLFTLVVITNGPEFSQIPKVEAVNLAAHVDHIIIGGQEPEQKPARSIFDKALKLANCDASEAIHVGDSLAADIAGAHHSRITSVWIQHQQPLDAELGINPNHTIMHPSELPSLIERLHKL